jgi:ABC-type Mn2+/Zn2+ transport system permease subunit/Mn-dependent DtxR family transcriptional regulator
MEAIVEIFQYEFATRALMASAMVGLMCGVLGCFIVLKNMSLIGDALSHAILPGVVLGFMVAGYSLIGFFTGSVLAGLAAAIFITWIQRNVKTQEDAAIGIVFTSMFALGVMGISNLTRKEGVHLDLKDFLFGNVLGISDLDLWMTFLVMSFTIICVVAFYRYFFITTFESVVAKTLGISTGVMHYFLMLLLSFAVVASLQSVGVILVVAMLITPASTAYLLTHRLRVMVALAGLIGVLSTTLGLLLAIAFETTPGPAMTVVATIFYLLAVFFSPQRGLVSQYFKRQQRQRKIFLEDVLKQSVHLQENQQLTLDRLAEKLSLSSFRLRGLIRSLIQQKKMAWEQDQPLLTPAGIQQGYALIRAHRLWETYLVKEMGLTEDQIHEDAEKYEHILSDELLDEVATRLGNPEQDPHGSAIPPKQLPEMARLSSLLPGQRAMISQRQPNHLIRSRLWDLGLGPGVQVQIAENGKSAVKVVFPEGEIEVPRQLAEQIRVERSIEDRK